MEFDTVAMIDCSFVPKNNDEELVGQVRKLYVCMTRAQPALLLSHHRANDIGASLHSMVNAQLTGKSGA
ncbi:hypothetical protein [Spongiibacter tropicus]|uniref:hypothetical protein n=1 Tax=Spongiibacter tropicus TaxID=454602 RepID=UPI003A99B4D8